MLRKKFPSVKKELIFVKLSTIQSLDNALKTGIIFFDIYGILIADNIQIKIIN